MRCQCTLFSITQSKFMFRKRLQHSKNTKISSILYFLNGRHKVHKETHLNIYFNWRRKYNFVMISTRTFRHKVSAKGHKVQNFFTLDFTV